jgi:hypothetical protein
MPSVILVRKEIHGFVRGVELSLMPVPGLKKELAVADKVKIISYQQSAA